MHVLAVALSNNACESAESAPYGECVVFVSSAGTLTWLINDTIVEFRPRSPYHFVLTIRTTSVSHGLFSLEGGDTSSHC